MLVQIGRGIIINVMSNKVQYQISSEYLNKLQNIREDFYHNRTEGEILTRFYDINEICQMITYVLISVITDILFLFIGSVVLFSINTTLFILAWSGITFFLTIILCFKKPIETVSKENRELYALLVSNIREIIGGNEIVKLYKEGYQRKREKTNGYLQKYLSKNYKGNILTCVENALSGFVQTGASIIILGIGVILVQQHILSLGNLITFEMLLSFILYPIEDLVQSQTEIQSAMVSLFRLGDVYNCEEETCGQGVLLKETNMGIQFQNVSFQYGYRKEIFHNLTFEIDKGSKCLLCGTNGSGKSTLAKLLLRFYEPTTGNIYIGNEDIHNYEVNALREVIEYIPSNSFFFQGSIKENLLLANPTASEEAIINACKIAGVEEYISKLPDSIHFILEENAKNFSVGERQKLALARAILKRPSIIIFDEALSGIDKDCRTKIYQNLLITFRDATCIFIAHEINIMEGIDAIYQIFDGKIEKMDITKKM